MRPPNPRLADDGTGPDRVVIFHVGIEPGVNQDEEGNWVKEARPTGITYTAVVVGQFATESEENGAQMSVTAYNVELFTGTDPQITVETPIEWRGLTLRLVGDTVAAGPGCWGFQAVEDGPDPDATGLPYEG